MTQAVFDLLMNHRSIRKYQDKPIEPELLQRIVVAGQAAATSSFIQAVSVIRVSDTAKRQTLMRLSGDQPYVASAAEFLVVCADLARIHQQAQSVNQAINMDDFAWVEQLITATVDASLFAQNMVVAAESAELGCCYIGGLRNQPDAVSTLLDLPDLVYPVFGLCMGYPAQQPGIKPRLPLSVVLKDNSYGKNYVLPEANIKTVEQYDQHVREYYIARTNGKLSITWSQQMAKQAAKQSRPFMRDFLQKRGWMLR